MKQYGCIDGRPSQFAGPYLGNLGPLLDEAVGEAPVFHIVALDDDMMSNLDKKATTTFGWDFSSCPVGNRYVLCSRKGVVKPKRYWTTLYGWTDRRDCTWRPYDDTKAGTVVTDQMLAAKRRPDSRRKSNKSKVVANITKSVARASPATSRTPGAIKKRAATEAATKLMESAAYAEDTEEAEISDVLPREEKVEDDIDILSQTEVEPETKYSISEVAYGPVYDPAVVQSTLAKRNWKRLFHYYCGNGYKCQRRSGKITRDMVDMLGVRWRLGTRVSSGEFIICLTIESGLR